ncbi:MAG: hypothetical protein AAF655_23525 [Bacteroidota bacterium]
MLEDGSSGSYIKKIRFNLNPNYLYKRYREVEKGFSEVYLSPEYMQIFLLFIGFENKEDFLKVCDKVPNSNKAYQLRLWGQELNQKSHVDNPQILFEGFYYSLENHEIRSFLLRIDSSRKVRRRDTSSFIQVQYKVQLSFILGGSQLKYIGIASRVAEFLHIHLWSQSEFNVRGANLILWVGAGALKDSKILSGIYSSNTIKGEIISGETILVNRSLVSHEKLESLILKKYAFSRAKQIVSTRNTPSVPSLRKENYDHNGRALKEYIGDYELYYLKGEDTMIVSHLVIREDYQISFQSPFNSYHALFRVSNSGDNFYLWFIRQVNFKTDFFSLINLNKQETLTRLRDKFYPGNILYVQRGGGHTSSKCLMRKVDQIVAPRYYQREDIFTESNDYYEILLHLINKS